MQLEQVKKTVFFCLTRKVPE